MNVLEMLAASAQNNHGRTLQPTHVKEIVTILQGMQYQIASDNGRLDALTRILAVTLNQLGGALDIDPSLFAQAENYVVDVEWETEEEGSVIHVQIRDAGVDLPEMQEEDEAAEGDLADVLPLLPDEDELGTDGVEDSDDS